ncbi:WhiB family transcriptional regulator [Streptomyces sp. NPDC057271]|uniref:WhiB family transcriptional regulator n=1 Tax=unclassified Streptomyces TaxID=2593676 RepID=UPI0036332C14
MSETRGIGQPRAYDWRDDADCQRLGLDPEGFFPVGTSAVPMAQAAEAKRFCRSCPVAMSCARWAIDRRIDDGVWGGVDELQRRHIFRTNNANQLNDPDHVGELVHAVWARDTSGPLIDTYLSRTEQEDNGHVRWTGRTTSNFQIEGRVYTPNQLAFVVGRKRRPVGIVRNDCGRKGCVAAEHLTDEEIRTSRDPFGVVARDAA